MKDNNGKEKTITTIEKTEEEKETIKKSSLRKALTKKK